MNKALLFFILIFFSISVAAQVVGGKHDRLAKYFENEKWEDCAFRADRMLLQDKNLNDAEIYLYLSYSYSKIFLMCLNDDALLEKVPDYVNAYKNALKYAVSAKKKDRKKHEVFPANNDLLEDIVIAGTYYIDNFVSKKKYAKARAYLGKMKKVYSDNNIDFMYAILSLMSDDIETGKPILDTCILKMKSNKIIGGERTQYMMIDAFDFYYTFLLEKEIPMNDSARNWIASGLEFFKDNELLLYDQFALDNPNASLKKPQNIRKKLSLNYINSSLIEDKYDKDNDDDDDDDDHDD